MMRIVFTGIIALMLGTAGIGPAGTTDTYQPGTVFVPKGITLEKNTYVYDSKKADLNSDGIEDDVVLYGVKEYEDSPFVGNIGIAVKNGQTREFSAASIGELNVGYEPQIYIGSFTKPLSQDILVSLATGGSGGVYQYSLLVYQDDQVKGIVTQKDLNQGLELETQCLPGYKLSVIDKSTNFRTTVDLGQGSVNYEEMGIYNKEGELLKNPMVLVDGYGVLKPEDEDNDGILELQGIQRISVGFHANTVAYAESTWKISNNKMKLISERIKDKLD
ncbi:hypothetical protein [Desulfosporosinus orientis]|nr:hypothetical protein [Desulfosporosinus orientis]